MTKEEMWKVAANQMGLAVYGWTDKLAIILETPEELEELFLAIFSAMYQPIIEKYKEQNEYL